jgi:hypothetical protein
MLPLAIQLVNIFNPKLIIMNLPNPIKTPWFKPKTIGWGWVPANTKGWLVILTFVTFVAINVSFYLIIREYTDKIVARFDDLTWMIIFYSTIQFISNFLLAIIALITVAKLTSSTK